MAVFRHDSACGRNRRPPLVTEAITLYRVVEICAGAGGQSLGLELAGFEHELCIELDPNACATLGTTGPPGKSPKATSPASTSGTPSPTPVLTCSRAACPARRLRSLAEQLGATDERDLFAWAIELCSIIGPRALLLENVRGLSLPRFAAYRQHVLDRLAELGYAADWRLLHASDYGVPQLRPRFVLIAMRPDDLAHFTWPEPQGEPPTVGETLRDLMAANGWPGAAAWAAKANDIAPTIVGGSKKHGGADLGPTRAKRAWRAMQVDALGVADTAPSANDPATMFPKLTCEMVARLQGWDDDRYRWQFTGRKTTNYRQIGNAFPPPVARAIGQQLRTALDHEGRSHYSAEQIPAAHDPIYSVLRDHAGFLTMEQILRRLPAPIDIPAFERQLTHLKRDFHIEVETRKSGDAYRLGAFKAFVGQDDHLRHEAFTNPTKIS